MSGRRRVRHGAAVVAVVAAVALSAAACSQEHSTTGPRIIRGASPETGAQLIKKYGCGTCHTIPDINGASGLVGPPLIHFGRRGTIAGFWANTPDNLTDWIQDPQHMLPGNDMPTLGITRTEARNIAAYLESLQ